MIATLAILVFSLIQSLFGMGLLVFGTPTLLLMGFSFAEVLAMLLPASVAISLLQVLEEEVVDRSFIKTFFTWCMPPLGLTLAAVLTWGVHVPLEMVLGLVLLAFALVRLVPGATMHATAIVRCNLTTWMVAMGVVHGLSNMGGSVLSIVASTQFPDKRGTRRAISFCYLCFGVLQIGLVVTLRPESLTPQNLLMVPLAALVYRVFGRRGFHLASEKAFHLMFTGFVLFYAALLIAKALGAF